MGTQMNNSLKRRYTKENYRHVDEHNRKGYEVSMAVGIKILYIAYQMEAQEIHDYVDNVLDEAAAELDKFQAEERGVTAVKSWTTKNAQFIIAQTKGGGYRGLVYTEGEDPMFSMSMAEPNRGILETSFMIYCRRLADEVSIMRKSRTYT